MIKEVSSFNTLLWQFTHLVIYTVNKHSLNANQQMLAAVNGQQKKSPEVTFTVLMEFINEQDR